MVQVQVCFRCTDAKLSCGFTNPFIRVRHGQGIHNVEGAKNYQAYMKPEYFDAHHTPLGWQQVDNLRKHVHECGLSKSIEIVVTSPLLRGYAGSVGAGQVIHAEQRDISRVLALFLQGKKPHFYEKLKQKQKQKLNLKTCFSNVSC